MLKGLEGRRYYVGGGTSPCLSLLLQGYITMARYQVEKPRNVGRGSIGTLEVCPCLSDMPWSELKILEGKAQNKNLQIASEVVSSLPPMP